jgi:hypothetical protein
MDMRDGKMLLKLLQVLSGERLVSQLTERELGSYYTIGGWGTHVKNFSENDQKTLP